MHWRTLKKMLEHAEPPGYQQTQARPRQKLGPFEERIAQILKEDQALPRKQRHTAKRLWERLQAEGFTGGYTIVKDVVREQTQRQQEVFVPLVHAPGEAQVDFGEALVKMNGVLRKVAFFVMALPYSDAPFVMAFERECTETFWEGHVQGFGFFGGVPTEILYDCMKNVVTRLGGAEPRWNETFFSFALHEGFAPRLCPPYASWVLITSLF